jgi:hypothetical protein
MLRRLLALALALLPLQGAATLVTEAPSDHAHCSGTVCRCVSHCPPKKKAARPCHEAAAPLGALVQSAGCRTGQDEAAAPVSTRPHVTPAPFDLGPAFKSVALAVPAASPALPGFLQIDLPPPRTRA